MLHYIEKQLSFRYHQPFVPKLQVHCSYTCFVHLKEKLTLIVVVSAGDMPSILSSDDVIFDQSNFVQQTATIGSPISLLSGSALKLRCPATGLPVPKVSWKVDGNVLVGEPGVVIDNVNHVLMVNKLNRGHSNRVIMCTAANTLGAVSASSRLTVTGKQIEPSNLYKKTALV